MTSTKSSSMALMLAKLPIWFLAFVLFATNATMFLRPFQPFPQLLLLLLLRLCLRPSRPLSRPSRLQPLRHPRRQCHRPRHQPAQTGITVLRLMTPPLLVLAQLALVPFRLARSRAVSLLLLPQCPRIRPLLLNPHRPC